MSCQDYRIFMFIIYTIFSIFMTYFIIYGVDKLKVNCVFQWRKKLTSSPTQMYFRFNFSHVVFELGI